MSKRYLPLLLLVVLACDGRAPWSDHATEGDGAAANDFGPVAAFERRLLFLTPQAPDLTAAGFDFALLDDSLHTYRSARILVEQDSAWRTVMDTAWSTEPMRSAWRLVPFGPLHLLVGEGDELEALAVEDDPETRLILRRAIDEFSPDAGTRLQIREADLVTGDHRVTGLVLDIQMGRSIAGSGAPKTIAAASGGRLAAVLEAANPTAPGERVEAFIAGDALLLALGESVDGPLGWLREAQLHDVWDGARVVTNDIITGDTVPDWQVLLGDGTPVGSLFTLSRHMVPLPGEAGGEVGLSVARGWVEIRGERRQVVAVLRHVQG